MRPTFSITILFQRILMYTTIKHTYLVEIYRNHSRNVCSLTLLLKLVINLLTIQKSTLFFHLLIFTCTKYIIKDKDLFQSTINSKIYNLYLYLLLGIIKDKGILTEFNHNMYYDVNVHYVICELIIQ